MATNVWRVTDGRPAMDGRNSTVGRLDFVLQVPPLRSQACSTGDTRNALSVVQELRFARLRPANPADLAL